MISIGIVTVSDRAHRGEYEDLSGPQAAAFLEGCLASQWQPVPRIVPDEADAIEKTLIELCDAEGCCIVLTTGGTGPAARDVTPDATASVCDRLLPGFGELMRAASLKRVPTAILSRQIAGTKGKVAHHQLAWQAECHTRVLGSGVPCCPRLRCPAWWAKD